MFKKALLIYLLCISSILYADNNNTPSSHAPIAVMADHYHPQGEHMLSYRFMSMGMDGARTGKVNLSSTEVNNAGFAVAPTKMSMNMHMLGYMFGASDTLTLMVMAPYLSNSMDSVTAAGKEFEVTSSGLGDVKIALIKGISTSDNCSTHIGFGLSIPTGKIDQKDAMANGQEATLGYGMQLGSGTYDLLPSITHQKRFNEYKLGVQFSGVIRTARNEKDYVLGNRFESTVWGQKEYLDWLSGSVRMQYINQGKVIDAHKDIATTGMSPVFNTAHTGGQQLNIGFGVNTLFSIGKAQNYRVNAEVLLPMMNNKNGIQLRQDYNLILGIQKTL